MAHQRKTISEDRDIRQVPRDSQLAGAAHLEVAQVSEAASAAAHLQLRPCQAQAEAPAVQLSAGQPPTEPAQQRLTALPATLRKAAQ